MKDNEIRLVHREETFNDLAVRELARGRSACICRLQFGACKKVECKACEISRNYSTCYKNLNEYDRERLATYVSDCYVEDSLTPERWMSYRSLKVHLFKWIILIFLCLAFIFVPLVMLAPGSEPKSTVEVSDDTHKRIVITKKLVDKNIKDINGDGSVNCQDYAITFKLIWDSVYPDCKNDCIIIRNRSMLMHHLFNGVYDGNDLVFIEPWASDPYNYLMRNNWNYKWNPRYNIYDETEMWLQEAR